MRTPTAQLNVHACDCVCACVYMIHTGLFCTYRLPHRIRRLDEILSFSFPDINLTRFQSERVALIFDLSSLNNATLIQSYNCVCVCVMCMCGSVCDRPIPTPLPCLPLKVLDCHAKRMSVLRGV